MDIERLEDFQELTPGNYLVVDPAYIFNDKESLELIDAGITEGEIAFRVDGEIIHFFRTLWGDGEYVLNPGRHVISNCFSVDSGLFCIINQQSKWTRDTVIQGAAYFNIEKETIILSLPGKVCIGPVVINTIDDDYDEDYEDFNDEDEFTRYEKNDEW